MRRVGIIIKTLNEEANIGRAIESSIKANAPYDGEVIVADSASIDHTIERAIQFPVIVVKIAFPSERCCGVGPQLGYQHSNSDYIYILDGDMELDAEFLKRAIGILDREPLVAGVGGYVREMRLENLEFKARVLRQKKWQPQEVPTYVQSLVGGGLYRRASIESVGYFSDRNLRAFEEYDLGVRLRKKGWLLVRMPDHAADHHSYKIDTFRLLLYRVRSGYIFGIGDLLRAAISGGYVRNVLFELQAMRIAIGVWLYWGIVFLGSEFCASSNVLVLILLSTALLLPCVAMAVRTRSITLGLFSVLLWHFSSLGLLIGLLRGRVSPTKQIQSQTFGEVVSKS